MSQERRQNQWFWRRLLIFGIAALCSGILIDLTWYGTQEGTLHGRIAEGCFWTLGLLVFIYVAGATAQDIVALVKGFRGGATVVETSTTSRQESHRVRDDRDDAHPPSRQKSSLPAD